MNFTYLIEVKDRFTNVVVKSLNVIGKRKANKVADGIRINLHSDFIVTETKINQGDNK